MAPIIDLEDFTLMLNFTCSTCSSIQCDSIGDLSARVSLCVHCAAKLIGALAAACKEKVGVELIMHEKPKGEDGSTQINELLEAVKASAESPVLGALQKVCSAVTGAVSETLSHAQPDIASYTGFPSMASASRPKLLGFGHV